MPESRGLKAQMIMGAESALDSAFAEYDKTMFEKYGITLFDGGTDGIQIKKPCWIISVRNIRGRQMRYLQVLHGIR